MPVAAHPVHQRPVIGAKLLRQQPHIVLGFGLYNLAKDCGQGFGGHKVIQKVEFVSSKYQSF
jgi:hypothetical protein